MDVDGWVWVGVLRRNNSCSAALPVLADPSQRDEHTVHGGMHAVRMYVREREVGEGEGGGGVVCVCFCGCRRDTWDGLPGRAADAQLAGAVVSPALDPAPGHDGARVHPPQGDGGGGNAWQKERK
jgi:hypothetical protein